MPIAQVQVPETEEPQSLEDIHKLMESDNILDTIIDELGEDEVKKIGSSLKDQFDDDLSSIYPFIKRQEEGTKLALQHKTIKNTPWPNASNVKHPLITIASTQFGARAYPAIIPGNNLVKTKVSPTKKDTEALSNRARRIATHMDYQILEEMEGWESDMDRMLSALLPLHGTVFKKTYYDPDSKLIVSELIPYDELIVDYDADNLESAYRKSHILWFTKNQVLEKINSGYFNEVELSDPSKLKEREIKREVFQQNRTKIDDSTQHMFVEMHTYEDLDGDGYEEPWIITFHYDTGEIVRINPGFDLNGVILDEEDNIIRIEQEQYFTKYGFLPNPESGIYDLGFNLLLGPLVDAMNTLINQLIDSGSLNNMQSGFIAKNFQVKGGNTRFRLGEWKTVNVFGENIGNGVFPLPTKEPSNVLFSLLGFIQEAANNVASVKDILLGENPGQNQKVGTTQAVLEQGLKTFTSIYKRVHRSLKSELQKIYRLNSLFLDEQRYFKIIGQEEIAQIGKQDYQDDIQVIPVSDANVATDAQRIAKVEALFKYLELGTVDPKEVTRRGLEAENQPEVEVLMNVPPPQPSMEEQLEVEKFKLEAAKQQQEFELKQLELRVRIIEAIGNIESEERKDAINAASSIAQNVRDKIKLELENEKLQQEKQQPAEE